MLNALKRLLVNETGLVAVGWLSQLPSTTFKGAPSSNLSSRPERSDLQFKLMEKRNPTAIRTRHFRCGRKQNCRSLPYATPDFLWGLVALANFTRPCPALRVRKSWFAPVEGCDFVGFFLVLVAGKPCRAFVG